MKPDLSILIVSWNTEAVLRDCLTSVELAMGRGGLSFEVILVDNGSTDGSASMVMREFEWVELICNRGNRGFAAANNQALSVASGRHVLLLNSDTLVEDDVLQRSVAYLDDNPDVGVMGCRVLNLDRSLQTSSSRFPSLLRIAGMTLGFSLGPVQLEEMDVEVVSGCYLMARRQAIDEVGHLDEGFFFFGEETDWCRRFASKGWKIRHAPVGQIVHLGGASALRLGSARDVMLTAAFIRLHRKHGGTLPAALVWIVLLGFNLSRCLIWFVAGVILQKATLCYRARHFAGVVRSYRKVWEMTA